MSAYSENFVVLWIDARRVLQSSGWNTTLTKVTYVFLSYVELSTNACLFVTYVHRRILHIL